MTNRWTVIDRRSVLAGGAGLALLPGLGAAALARSRTLDPVLADLHRRTFRYFWDTAHPLTGLAPDNWPNPKFASIAATGFALTAYAIGAASGYVARAKAAQRALVTLSTFARGRQGPGTSGVIGHKGFFYHFLDMAGATRFGRCELSSVDTALFVGGALSAAGYFDRDNPVEAQVRATALRLYEGVDWCFMARDNGLVSMGWHPEPGMRDHDARGLIDRNWDRYNEGMLIYLLGLASPTHPLPAGAWASWSATIGGSWRSDYGESRLGFSPMFGHQYSHGWFDFRGIADTFMRGKGIDYFINSQRATVAQRAYAVSNPGGFAGYGAECWGLTACQGPADASGSVRGRRVTFREYGARGIQDGDGESFDDGTIAPTAAIGSTMFRPDLTVPLIHALRRRYPATYREYGFVDAFNPSFPADLPSKTGNRDPRAGWVCGEYLGIDQGPILIGLENHRSGTVWDWFCRGAATGPIVRRGLRAAGFRPVAASGAWLDHQGVSA
jgi:hypothetical protein